MKECSSGEAVRRELLSVDGQTPWTHLSWRAIVISSLPHRIRFPAVSPASMGGSVTVSVLSHSPQVSAPSCPDSHQRAETRYAESPRSVIPARASVGAQPARCPPQ